MRKKTKIDLPITDGPKIEPHRDSLCHMGTTSQQKDKN